MTDYYDTKISAFDVCNKAELQHIHKNLAEFMKANNIPGADYVYTGKTGGINFSVKPEKYNKTHRTYTRSDKRNRY